jgi:two-component system CheB/CheR fusion protein
MPDERPRRLVVIGSSAGGIDALSTLVSTLPAGFCAPVIIAQHLDPRRVSHLGEILQRRSVLPVQSVAETTRLEPGVIYVVPADHHVEVSDEEVRLRPTVDDELKPSVDRLLSSAAETYGDGLIAVILTGSGSDGAAGARRVAEAGGTVIIQNPETAAFPSMPQSLDPTTVDVVANIDHIGPLLHDLSRGDGDTADPENEAMLRALLDQLREHNGVDFSAYKTPTIMRRLQRRMAATGTKRLSDYMRYLGSHPDEYQRLISNFLIKVTEFFRDPELFDMLREHVLPHLVREARARENEVRFWSAGCATGEEAYSLAILLAEVLRSEIDRFSIRIFATDLDNAAIEFARRGIFPASALRSLPAELRTRYFTENNGEYEVKWSIRNLLIFGQHDLGQRAPFPRIDLALCRNVLIYFTPELQKRALQLFAFSLRDSGYLVLGKAETTTPLPQYFALENAQQKIFRRVGERVLIPPTRLRGGAAPKIQFPSPPRAPSSLDLLASRGRRETRTPATPGERAESLLLELPVGVVVVDRHYDIQLINAMARRLFGIHEQGIGDDFIHQVRTMPTGPLRAAIDVALRGEPPPEVRDVVLAETVVEGPRYVQFICYPHGEETAGVPEGALILASDVTATVQERERQDRVEQETGEESVRLRSQVQRLSEANHQLLRANQELTTLNAELRSSNDEFLLATEEAQAATEEIETLNEELQATNEELETLNEELQATVEELNTTNDDMQARSAELQEMAAASEAERQRLAAILSSMSDAVLVVDSSGRVVLNNPAAEQMFGSDLDFVPEETNGRPLPPSAWPLHRASQGETFTAQFTFTDPVGNRRWLEANGRPVNAGEAEQGIVVIRDISERTLRRLQEQFVAVAGHELRTPLVPLQGYLQMSLRLLADRPEDDPARQYATLALAQIADLTSRIDDLTDATRLQSGKFHVEMEPVALRPLIEQVVATTRGLGEGQRIETELAEEPLVINGDASRVRQVLVNLLNNAIRYAPESPRVDVRLRRSGDSAEIEVQDYGPGIPAEDLPRIFTQFYQVERAGAHGGLGLGLFISREIVNALGGSIDVRSTVGEGTTFIVQLPLIQD